LLQRSTFTYRARKKEEGPLRMRLRELAEARRRYGYRRLAVLLQREGLRTKKLDFVSDRLEDGHTFRVLTVVDVFTRECIALHADRNLSGRQVAQVLEAKASTRGLPKEITVDNGTEFFSK
jgi:putative transposase